MSKLTLNNIASGFATNTIINSNFDAIEAALENTVSRDGSSPNHMLAELNMNSFPITNVGRAATLNSAVSLGQVLEYINTTEDLTGVVPITWEFTSTGATSYNLALASTNKVDMYIVSSNGIILSPTSYNIDVEGQRIYFNSPPVLGANIVVRLFGKIPEAVESSVDIRNIRQSYFFDVATNETTFTTPLTLEENTDVYLNGVKLIYAVDYTVAGMDVELASPATPGDILEVIVYNSIVVASDILQDVIDATADVEALMDTLGSAIDENLSAVTATASTLSAGSSATASFDVNTKVLSLGVPTGATGATGPTGAAGAGVATGGTAGQILTKVNSTDYNTAWSNTLTAPTISGNISLSGATVISGNFTGTPSSSLSFQSTNPSGETNVFVVGPPTGTQAAYLTCYATSVDTPTCNIGVGLTGAYLSTGVSGTASYVPLAIETGGSARIYITTSGLVGFANTSPTGLIHVGTDGVVNSGIVMSSRPSYFSESITFNSGNPTVTSLISGDSTGGLVFRSNDATGNDLRLTPGGDLLVGRGSLGYGGGTGGTVTQGTSRNTDVSAINKPTGAITLFSAAGSTTPFTFNVPNSTVAATDVIILSQKTGANKYHFAVTAVAAGQFTITGYAFSGTATEAPVINFAVIKAVTY